jgi:hypothetical protein
MTNISDLCYNFIRENSSLFELERYDINHSINFELLDQYVSKQNCSEKYFELLRYIYRQSTYIDCQTFIKHYTSNINELNENFNDKEIIVLFPYLDTNKSNFFLTLYFLYLYNFILSKNVNYVFSYKTKDKKQNIIDISTLSLTKEPLFVICDDFLYSGGQLSLSISKLPFICSDSINIYACTVGMTNKAIDKFSKQKLIELGKDFYEDEDEEVPINCSYDVIFPQSNLIINTNLKTILRDKMIEEGLYNDSISEIEQIYEYILLNDMYILENINNKLYALGQFSKLYYNLNNTLIYLFFKYPDLISSVLTMCVLNQYLNKYTVSLDRLVSPIRTKKYPINGNNVINKFEITQDLFEDVQDLEELKENIKNSTPIDITKFPWLQKCSDYDFNLDRVRFVNADYNSRIELIRNIKSQFNSISGSLCNDSIITFYKQKDLISSFNVLRDLIKSSIISGGKHSSKYKKTNKKVNKKYNKKYNKNKSKKIKKYIKNKTKKIKNKSKKRKQ